MLERTSLPGITRRHVLISAGSGLVGGWLGLFANAASAVVPAGSGARFGVFGFFARKKDMAMKDFMDYYEHHHAPLICRLAPAPPVYKRRYLNRGEKFIEQGIAMADFDVVTEVGFADRAAFMSWVEQLDQPDARKRVAQDEMNLFDRSRMQAYAFEEYATTG